MKVIIYLLAAWALVVAVMVMAALKFVGLLDVSWAVVASPLALPLVVSVLVLWVVALSDLVNRTLRR